MVSKKSVGIKNDKDNLRIDLITPEMITALAKVLKYGASEYGERNFEKGIDFSREWAAAQRHLWAWWNGENIDESGFKHLWHALSAIAILVTLDERPNMKKFDNRPIKIKSLYLDKK
jgi:hypothetical protein